MSYKLLRDLMTKRVIAALFILTMMVSIAALFIYGQKLDVPAMLGMGLIVLGVVVIQLFSKTAGH